MPLDDSFKSCESVPEGTRAAAKMPAPSAHLAKLLDKVEEIDRQMRLAQLLGSPGLTSRSYRFSQAKLAATRKRLGLSASQCGRLLNVSYQTVINWEAGAQPHSRYLPSLAEFTRLGKRQVARRLQATALRPGTETNDTFRFSQANLVALRKRLGLSASQCGRLLDVSYQTVLNWENGVSPHPRNLPALAELDSMTTSAVNERLQLLKKTLV